MPPFNWTGARLILSSCHSLLRITVCLCHPRNDLFADIYLTDRCSFVTVDSKSVMILRNSSGITKTQVEHLKVFHHRRLRLCQLKKKVLFQNGHLEVWLEKAKYLLDKGLGNWTKWQVCLKESKWVFLIHKNCTKCQVWKWCHAVGPR